MPGTTGAFIYVSPRQVSGAFSSTGVPASVDQTNLKAWLPPARIPIGYVTIDDQKYPVQINEQSWWKFFSYVANTRLGGIDGATIPDIASAVSDTQVSTGTIFANQQDIANQANANANALAVQIAVSNAAALPGAAQIPAPVVIVIPQQVQDLLNDT